MPLPTSTSIPLMGCSRPGEVAPSRPKQAMIVRMSAEAFDALQAFPNHPQMFFQFDEKSGIYIGDTFYPMRSMKEETLHELYLRSAPMGKKPTSLKLHANVTGKFFVERAFSERVQGKIREATINTAKQNERNIIVIDTPPDLAPTTHPRKRNQNPASTMFRSTVRPGDFPKLNTPASLPTTRVSSPMPPKPIKKDKATPLRKRLVHCLAVCERTREQTVKLVGGAECDPTVRREILNLLDDVAEQAAVPTRGEDQANQNWRLKPNAWLDVRPYEWPKLTEPERINMARTARQKLRSLRIPETDPAWEHVKFRTSPAGAAPSPAMVGSSNMNPVTQSASAREPKRGVTSKEAREKKARPRPDPKAEIMMKDESIRAAPRSGTSEGNVKDVGGSLKSPSKSITRKAPGSGFRVGQTPSQDGRSDTAEGSGSNKVSRSKPTDARVNKDRDPSGNSYVHPPRPVQKEGKSNVSAQSQRMKQMRESGGGGTDSERERVPPGVKDKPSIKRRDDQDRHPAEEREITTLKRKKITHGDDVSKSAPQKKRKTDSGAIHPGPISTFRTGEALLPAKPEVALSSQPIVKKEHSPFPIPSALPKIKKDHHSSRHVQPETNGSPHESKLSSQARKANVAIKARRRSPIYTTSEDDSDPRRSIQEPMPLPTPPLTSEHTTRTTHLNSQHRPHTKDVHPLPTDHASLRSRYNASYLEYLATFQKLVAQKGKLDSMLTSHEMGSVGSITDSDGDVELLDTEDLMKLKSDHSRLKEELTSIIEIFRS